MSRTPQRKGTELSKPYMIDTMVPMRDWPRKGQDVGKLWFSPHSSSDGLESTVQNIAPQAYAATPNSRRIQGALGVGRFDLRSVDRTGSTVSEGFHGCRTAPKLRTGRAGSDGPRSGLYVEKSGSRVQLELFEVQ